MAVIYLGENVGDLKHATEDAGDRFFWAKKGTIEYAFPADMCTLVPSEFGDYYPIVLTY